MLKVFLALFVMSFAAGCVNVATATVDPAVDLSRVKTAYVVKLPKDERGVNRLIADKLKDKGVSATTGADPKPSNAVDAIVTYADRWHWDITMYMLELTITVRDPRNEVPMATGRSLHTSLTRKSPEEMVAEVLDSIYKGKQ